MNFCRQFYCGILDTEDNLRQRSGERCIIGQLLSQAGCSDDLLEWLDGLGGYCGFYSVVTQICQFQVNEDQVIRLASQLADLQDSFDRNDAPAEELYTEAKRQINKRSNNWATIVGELQYRYRLGCLHLLACQPDFCPTSQATNTCPLA